MYPGRYAGSAVLREAVLIAATMTTCLMAGVSGRYSHTVMPGLRRTDDRTFVTALQSIDRAILNPPFMSTFVGALALTGVAALLHLAGDVRPALPWIVAALMRPAGRAVTCPPTRRTRTG